MKHVGLYSEIALSFEYGLSLFSVVFDFRFFGFLFFLYFFPIFVTNDAMRNW